MTRASVAICALALIAGCSRPADRQGGPAPTTVTFEDLTSRFGVSPMAAEDWLRGRPITITGVVELPPQGYDSSWTLSVKAAQAADLEAWRTTPQFHLSFDFGNSLRPIGQRLQPGDRVTCTGTVQKIDDMMANQSPPVWTITLAGSSLKSQ